MMPSWWVTYQNASRISQTTVHSSYNQMKNNKSASYFPSPIKVCASKSRKRAEIEREKNKRLLAVVDSWFVARRSRRQQDEKPWRDRREKERQERQDIPSNDHFKSPASVWLSLLSDALNNATHVEKAKRASWTGSCAATQESVSKFLLQQNNNVYSNMPTSVKGTTRERERPCLSCRVCVQQQSVWLFTAYNGQQQQQQSLDVFNRRFLTDPKTNDI